MEEDKEPVAQGNLNGGLDSDDETLRFEQEDDLYAADLDEADAKWVLKQHRPATECEQEPGEDNTNGKNERGEDDGDEDVDPAIDDQPPTVSGNKHATGNQKRRATGGQQQKGGTADENGGGAVEGLATDAQLSCPLCFTTVCLQCQRHAKYLNQFRAVTGINVNVDHEKFLTLDQVSGGGGGGGGGRKKAGSENRRKASEARHSRGHKGMGAGNQPPEEGVGGGGAMAGEEEEEMFHPVCCGECDHIVGVYDAEEVYHFFGVIASG